MVKEFDVNMFILLAVVIVTQDPKPFFIFSGLGVGLFVVSYFVFNVWVALSLFFVYLFFGVWYLRVNYFKELEATCWSDESLEELE